MAQKMQISDFLLDKYKKLLKAKIFKKIFNIFFAEFCLSLGSVLFSRDGRVIANIHQPLEVSCKKGVLRNFAKFSGKHLYKSLFFNKVVG